MFPLHSLALGSKSRFWEAVASCLSSTRGAVLDEHHRFGPADELIIERSPSPPVADSRLVHFDPTSDGYIVLSPERLRWQTVDGVTVFQETSPWDLQLRQDPPVNFHAVVQPALARGEANGSPLLEHSDDLSFLRQDARGPDVPASLRWARGWRGPFLYPETEANEHVSRNTVVFAPTGVGVFIKDIRLPHRGQGAGPDARLALRAVLAHDELLVSFGAQNTGLEAIRVSLISFFLPLLTRGTAFHAESPWFHEGWRVGPTGTLIRSSESGLACGVREVATSPTERWQNLNLRAYYGASDRCAAFPAALEGAGRPDHRDHAGFVAPACAHAENRRVLLPGEDVVVHFGVKAVRSTEAAEEYLLSPFSPEEVEGKVAASAERGRSAIGHSGLIAPSAAFTSFFQWTKQQVMGCARIQPGFRLFPNYLLGVRDKAQAAYALVDFDPQVSRSVVLELMGQQFEDGRFPRQYSFDGRYDLRYFMDSGLWLASMLVPHYLKSTGDFAVLFEEAGYLKLTLEAPEATGGSVRGSARKSTVLDHLIENVEHVLRHRDPETGLVAIRDGDWNDAIGLIKSSTMVLEQLYFALAELLDLSAHLPAGWRRHPAARRLQPGRYKALMDELYQTFMRSCVQRHPDGRLRIIHGYTKEGRTVGGFWDSDRVTDPLTLRKVLGPNHRRWAESFKDSEGRTLYRLHHRWVDPDCERIRRLPESVRDLFLVDRISSTAVSFAVLSGVLRHRSKDGQRETAHALETAVRKDAHELDSGFGWRTFSRPFNRYSHELGIGRIGRLDGAENASPYVHAGMFLCQALYRLGCDQDAANFLSKTLPLNRTVHRDQNRAVQYVPNSWGIGRNNYGTSMNDFHTNSAAILERIVVEEIVGLRLNYDGIVLQPAKALPDIARSSPCAPRLEYSTTLRGERLRIIHEWSPDVDERTITLGRRHLDLRASTGRRGSSAFIPWSSLSGDGVNVLVVRDPMSAAD